MKMVKSLYIILCEFTACKASCSADQYMGGTACDGSGRTDTVTCEGKFFKPILLPK